MPDLDKKKDISTKDISTKELSTKDISTKELSTNDDENIFFKSIFKGISLFVNTANKSLTNYSKFISSVFGIPGIKDIIEKTIYNKEVQNIIEFIRNELPHTTRSPEVIKEEISNVLKAYFELAETDKELFHRIASDFIKRNKSSITELLKNNTEVRKMLGAESIRIKASKELQELRTKLESKITGFKKDLFSNEKFIEKFFDVIKVDFTKICFDKKDFEPIKAFGLSRRIYCKEILLEENIKVLLAPWMENLKTNKFNTFDVLKDQLIDSNNLNLLRKGEISEYKYKNRKMLFIPLEVSNSIIGNIEIDIPDCIISKDKLDKLDELYKYINSYFSEFMSISHEEGAMINEYDNKIIENEKDIQKQRDWYKEIFDPNKLKLLFAIANTGEGLKDRLGEVMFKNPDYFKDKHIKFTDGSCVSINKYFEDNFNIKELSEIEKEAAKRAHRRFRLLLGFYKDYKLLESSGENENKKSIIKQIYKEAEKFIKSPENFVVEDMITGIVNYLRSPITDEDDPREIFDEFIDEEGWEEIIQETLYREKFTQYEKYALDFLNEICKEMELFKKTLLERNLSEEYFKGTIFSINKMIFNIKNLKIDESIIYDYIHKLLENNKECGKKVKLNKIENSICEIIKNGIPKDFQYFIEKFGINEILSLVRVNLRKENSNIGLAGASCGMFCLSLKNYIKKCPINIDNSKYYIFTKIKTIDDLIDIIGHGPNMGDPEYIRELLKAIEEGKIPETYFFINPKELHTFVRILVALEEKHEKYPLINNEATAEMYLENVRPNHQENRIIKNCSKVYLSVENDVQWNAILRNNEVIKKILSIYTKVEGYSTPELKVTLNSLNDITVQVENEKNQDKGEKTFVVIDATKNPLRERKEEYSKFKNGESTILERNSFDYSIVQEVLRFYNMGADSRNIAILPFYYGFKTFEKHKKNILEYTPKTA